MNDFTLHDPKTTTPASNRRQDRISGLFLSYLRFSLVQVYAIPIQFGLDLAPENEHPGKSTRAIAA